MPDINIHHCRLKILVTKNQVRGNDPILENFLIMIKVMQKQIESSNPLLHPIFQGFPFLCTDHTGDHIKGQNPVNRLIVRIDCERDSEIKQLPFGIT